MTEPQRPPFSLWIFALLLAFVLLAAYGGDVGAAFVKEDAVWIMHSRVAGPADIGRLLTESGGFFRPVVAFSFALNYWMFGGNPLGYGWTNLLLAVACAAAIFQFSRAIGLPDAAALLAAGLWILNFHGINMAVLWMSGRTALLLVLFAVLAAAATARNRLVVAAACALLAMGSKEEGVLLPFALLAIPWLRPSPVFTRRRIVAFASAFVVVWAVYAALRIRSDAMTPLDAPPFYTLAGDLSQLPRNLAEYADRALTFFVAAALLVLLVARRRPRLTADETNIAALGGIWLAVGFGLTMWLPARSSLYVLLPSVGSALACAALVSATWRELPPARRRGLALAAALVPLLLVPIYWQRNVRWTELAAISREVVAAFRVLAAEAPEPWEVILLDDRTTRANIALALAVPEAVELTTGRRPRVWMAPPPEDLEPGTPIGTPATAHAVLALRGGRIVRLPLEEWRPVTAADLR